MYETIFKKIKDPDNIKLQPNSMNMLTELATLIFESDNIYENTIADNQTFHMQNINNNFIYQIPNFNLYPEKIQHQIEKMKKICINFSFNINDHIFNIFIITELKQKINIDDYFENIYKWLYVATKFSHKECSKHMDIYITTCDLEKKLPKHNETLDEIHCNSAFTTSCKPSTTIHVFRKEEWFKVFIHETFHSLGLDFSSMNQLICKSAILSIFPLHIDLRLYECYTELFAEIIHLLFFCCNKRKNETTAINMFKKELKQIQQFSFFQCAKILHHYNLQIENLYERGSPYTENTPVFSYYILKSMMLFHFSDFINWCSTHNKTIQFNNNNNNLRNFCLFIKKTIDSSKHTVYDDIIRDTTNMIANNDDDISDVYKNLKMTLIEFP